MINIISSMCNDMGMVKNNETNPFGCGSFFQGDGYTTRGYFWFLPHGEHFVITKCDFYFLKDPELTMPNDSLYISLRLEYAKHLPPGMIMAYLDENCTPIMINKKKALKIFSISLLVQNDIHNFTYQI